MVNESMVITNVYSSYYLNLSQILALIFILTFERFNKHDFLIVILLLIIKIVYLT